MIDDMDLAVRTPKVPKPSRRGTLFFKTMVWLIIAGISIGVCIAAAILLLGNELTLSHLDALRIWLLHTKPYACAIHLILIGWLWWKWEALIGYLSASGRLHPSMQQAVRASRNRIVMMLLAVEIFVVMEFPFSLFRAMQ